MDFVKFIPGREQGTISGVKFPVENISNDEEQVTEEIHTIRFDTRSHKHSQKLIRDWAISQDKNLDDFPLLKEVSDKLGKDLRVDFPRQ